VTNPVTESQMRCDRCDGTGYVAGLVIDLTKPYQVPMPCGCIVIFDPPTHRKCHTSANSTCENRKSAKHTARICEKARRIRCTKMERIE